jgi:hypothetical protein
MRVLRCLALVALVSTTASVARAQTQGPTDAGDKPREHWIGLKSRRIEPAPGIEPALAQRMAAQPYDRFHVIVQFEKPVTEATAEARLGRFGAVVLDYLPLDSWIVEGDLRLASAIDPQTGVRWIGALTAEDRIDPALLHGPAPAHALTHDGKLRCLVQLFAHVEHDAGRSLLAKHAEVVDEPTITRSWTVAIRPASLEALTHEEAVQWIEAELPPGQSKADGLRANTNIGALQGAPFSLDGAGIIVGIWEPGMPDTTSAKGTSAGVGHDDYYTNGAGAIRVTAQEAVKPVDNHATKVNGIVVGDGFASDKGGNAGGAGQWAGFAPRATSLAWDNVNPAAETATAFNAGKNPIVLSNNSYGPGECTCVGGPNAGQDCPPANCAPGTCTGRNAGFDTYTQQSADFDSVVLGRTAAGTERGPLFFAAGNEASCGTTPPPAQPPWHTINNSGATAKDTVTLGAIQSDTDAIWPSSSCGPTADGRIKPDLVAPGCEAAGDLGVKGPANAPTDTYYVSCGTSFATPATAGTAALLIQDWKAQHANKLPSPAIIKALLICGARDLGAAGPNFDFGYGAVDARQSLREARKGSIVTIGNQVAINNKDNTVPLKLPAGVTKVQATLVWDDPPPALTAAQALVNDLDLALIDPVGAAVRLPWRLDPTAPTTAAIKALDSRNNVEQVEHANPNAGTWTIRVRGFNVPKGPQPYAVCVRLTGASAAWKFSGPALGGQIWSTIGGQQVTANTVFNQTAAQVAAAYAAAVNADATMAALGIGATSAGDTVTITGILADQIKLTSIQDEGVTGSIVEEISGVGWTSKTDFGWQHAKVGGGKGTVHDVVRGKRADLPVGGGGEVCLASGTNATSVTDNAALNAGEMFWYIVRGRNALGTGTYGYRSNGVERVTGKCPG